MGVGQPGWGVKVMGPLGPLQHIPNHLRKKDINCAGNPLMLETGAPPRANEDRKKM